MPENKDTKKQAEKRKTRNNKTENKDDGKQLVNNSSSVSENKIISWNVAGLLDHLEECNVVNYLWKFDLICLQETYLMYNFNTDIKFKNYVCVQSHAAKLSAAGCPSGGVIMF